MYIHDEDSTWRVMLGYLFPVAVFVYISCIVGEARNEWAQQRRSFVTVVWAVVRRRTDYLVIVIALPFLAAAIPVLLWRGAHLDDCATVVGMVFVGLYLSLSLAKLISEWKERRQRGVRR